MGDSEPFLTAAAGTVWSKPDYPGEPQQVLRVDPGAHRFGRPPVSRLSARAEHGHRRQPQPDQLGRPRIPNAYA